MTRPFESDLLATHAPLLVATKEDIVEHLRRVARDLNGLELSLKPGNDTGSLSAASRAVYLALVELNAFV